MSEERWGPQHFGMERINALTDGVIAIVITLLVLELSVPVVRELEHSDGLWPEIRELWREYLAYILSFFICGILWLYHHTVVRRIHRADARLLALNIFYLLAVSITPFSSALVAKNWDERLAAIIYGSSLLLAAGCAAGMFAYASWHRRLVDLDMSAAFIRRENKAALWLLGVIAVATFLGYFTPYMTYVILGVLVVGYWVSVFFGREGISGHRPGVD